MRYLLMVMALTAGLAVQAKEKSDTTVIENAKKVTIITSDSLQKVRVRGKEGNDTYFYENSITYRDKDSDKRKYEYDEDNSGWDFDFGFGWAIPTNVPSEISFATFRSWEWMLGLRYRYTPKRKLQSYSTGLWVNWRGYTLRGDKAFAKGDQSIVEISEFPENASHKHSSINIFSLSVPFFFTQKFGHKSKFKLTLGPVVNVNLRGRINNEYDLGDDEFEISTKGIEYRTLTVDFMGVVSYSGISVYCKYSPMSVLKTDKGPQFHSLTLGVFF